MQRHSSKFWSQQFFLCEICGEVFLPKFLETMLVPIRMGTNIAAGNQQKHLSLSFATKA